MTDIKSNLEKVRERIAGACCRAGRSPDSVTIIAATKTTPPELITEAFGLGIRHFGENRVQEAEPKIKALSGLEPRPVWHMIGHLQTNKVKQAVELFDIIQSVDSLRLAQALDRHTGRKMQVLLEVNIAGEASKTGFAPEEVKPALDAICQLPNIDVRGLMTIAPLVHNPEKARPVFRQLRELRDKLCLEHLSMGMTDDFEVAIEEGATMVRIGRAIVGSRKREVDERL